MKVQKWLAGSMAVAMLAMGSAARAADSNSSGGDSLVMHPILADNTPSTAPSAPTTKPAPAATQTPPAPTTLIDGGLDAVGLYKPLNALGFDITGFTEMGYLYDTSVPRQIDGVHRYQGDLIGFAGAYKNALILDATTLNIYKPVDFGKLQNGRFDYGFQVEGTYGRDGFYTHSNGLLDNNSVAHGDDGPDNELDLENCYVELGLPIGNGLMILAGKLSDMMGYEKIDAPENILYTHSYAFAYGQPRTQTGIFGEYSVTEDSKVLLTAGTTRGWNQSTNDDNGSPDVFAQLAGKINSEWVARVNLSVGPQYPHDESHYMTVCDFDLIYKSDNSGTAAADLIYGSESASPQNGISETQYYGVAVTEGGPAQDHIRLTDRLEWFQANGNNVPAIITNDGVTKRLRGTNNYWAFALGLSITPLPDTQYLKTLTIRPEIRYDWSDHKVYDGVKFSQCVAAIDAYITY